MTNSQYIKEVICSVCFDFFLFNRPESLIFWLFFASIIISIFFYNYIVLFIFSLIFLISFIARIKIEVIEYKKRKYQIRNIDIRIFNQKVMLKSKEFEI